MMRPGDRIHSEAQLSIGMTVLIKACRLCGKDHQHVLAARTPRGSWRTCGILHLGATSLELGPAIREGRLRILADRAEVGVSAFENAVADGLRLIDERKAELGVEHARPGT